jgi:soluble cytochrome b562
MLREQMQKLAAEIDNLESYLNEGSQELERASSTIVSSSSADASSVVTDGHATF